MAEKAPKCPSKGILLGTSMSSSPIATNSVQLYYIDLTEYLVFSVCASDAVVYSMRATNLIPQN